MLFAYVLGSINDLIVLGPSVRWEGAGTPLWQVLPWPAETQLTSTPWRCSCEYWAWLCCRAGRERTRVVGNVCPFLPLINSLSSVSCSSAMGRRVPYLIPTLSTAPLLMVTLPSVCLELLSCSDSSSSLLNWAQFKQEGGTVQFRMETSSLRKAAARGGCMATVSLNLTSDLIIYQTKTMISKLQRLNSTQKRINIRRWLLWVNQVREKVH